MRNQHFKVRRVGKIFVFPVKIYEFINFILIV